LTAVRKRRKKKQTMKLKDAFLVFCIGALIVSEIFLFSARTKMSAAQVLASAAQHEVEQARADLEQFKTTVKTQIAEDSKLRSDNQVLIQKLAKLQDANTRLSNTNRLLTQQIVGVREAAEQQQAQMQQIQSENQAASERNTCIANLRQIDSAKLQWAADNNKTLTDTPAAQDLAAYLPGGVFPVCPSGGSYTINSVGLPPSCSIPGHAVPPQ
jgi:multidrug resistance efflux pump